jgi:hypothetical protein
MFFLVLGLVGLVLPPKAPCQTPSSQAPNCPPLFPTNSEDVSIRTPFHGTYRSSILDMKSLWGFQHLRFGCYTELRGKACVLDIATTGVSVIRNVTTCKIDIPMGADRDKRKPRVDNDFDSSTRLFIIVCARFFVRMNLLPFLDPFGHLNVMYARALPLRVGPGLGTVIGLSCMSGSTSNSLGEKISTNFSIRSASVKETYVCACLSPLPL